LPPPAVPDSKARSDYRCADCGYGVVAAGPPSFCPLCGGVDWDQASWRPFSHPGDDFLQTVPPSLGDATAGRPGARP